MVNTGSRGFGALNSPDTSEREVTDMASTISLPVRATLGVCLENWYASDARLLAVTPSAAAELCPATAGQQERAGHPGATAKQDPQVNAAHAPRDRFARPGESGFPHLWWTSV